ncbi:MAG TPA: pyridoxamine 5'-phosphate oxidase family protein [Bacilli bacterium]
MTEAATQLSETLFALLQKETFCLLGTTDAETGGPAANAISWIYAVNPATLRFAVDQRSRIISNVNTNSTVNVTLFGGGTVNVVYGHAKVIKNELEEVPFKLSCMDIEISFVRDAMFYGARISTEPEYEKTYDKRAAAKLDNQVFSAMRKA